MAVTDWLQLFFVLLLFSILYVLVIYSLLTFVWAATISPLRITQFLFPKLVTSSHATGMRYEYHLLLNFEMLSLSNPCITLACGF